LTESALEPTFSLNFGSVVYSNRAAVRAWLAAGTGGTVLNLASVLATHPSPRHFATHLYAASKSALLGLTRAAASYYAPHNIRFNAVAPGLVATAMSQRAQQTPEIVRYIASKQPLDGGRIGQAVDLDAAVVYFLSDASRFVTGQVLQIDGGWSLADGQLSGPDAE
jgi:NAD(P)-dependent dehydrogenase (short-subunit alcohol dehydrogenase family)